MPDLNLIVSNLFIFLHTSTMLKIINKCKINESCFNSSIFPILKMQTVDLMLGPNKRFEITEVITHGPGCSVLMSRERESNIPLRYLVTASNTADLLCTSKLKLDVRFGHLNLKFNFCNTFMLMYGTNFVYRNVH